MAPIKVFFIDDHILFRKSVARLLEREGDIIVVGQSGDLSDLDRLLEPENVDVLLLDYDLGAERGTDLLRLLRARNNHLKVLMVTGGIRASVILQAVDFGIAGLVLKHSDPQQLVNAIQRVANGETWWDTAIIRSMSHKLSNPHAGSETNKALTARQRDVLGSILDGYTNKEIAAHLNISETAVKASIQELFSKAGVRTRSQLVRVAIERYSAEWLREL